MPKTFSISRILNMSPVNVRDDGVAHVSSASQALAKRQLTTVIILSTIVVYQKKFVVCIIVEGG